MKEEGYGTFFKASISDGTIRLVGYAHVDNTDLIQTGKDRSETGMQVLQKMQDGLDLWEGLVSPTGGAIEVAKSTWWLIDFIWNNDGKWRYATKDDIPAELWVKDASGGRQAVPQLETSQVFETLGIHLGHDGSQLAAYDFLGSHPNCTPHPNAYATFKLTSSSSVPPITYYMNQRNLVRKSS
jgi:hypothetical protein